MIDREELEEDALETEQELFAYLDDLYAKETLNLQTVCDDIRLLLSLPPARAAQLLYKWHKTFSARHSKEARA